MTLKLRSRSKPDVLITRLMVASSMWSRMKGLLGRKELPASEALWIPHNNSIHTFFMKFAIDVVFLDRDMKVRKTVANVKPGRLLWPVWRATSVIELSAGFLDKHPLVEGEQLHVDSTLS